MINKEKHFTMRDKMTQRLRVGNAHEAYDLLINTGGPRLDTAIELAGG